MALPAWLHPAPLPAAADAVQRFWVCARTEPRRQRQSGAGTSAQLRRRSAPPGPPRQRRRTGHFGSGSQTCRAANRGRRPGLHRLTRWRCAGASRRGRHRQPPQTAAVQRPTLAEGRKSAGADSNGGAFTNRPAGFASPVTHAGSHPSPTPTPSRHHPALRRRDVDGRVLDSQQNGVTGAIFRSLGVRA